MGNKRKVRMAKRHDSNRDEDRPHTGEAGNFEDAWNLILKVNLFDLR